MAVASTTIRAQEIAQSRTRSEAAGAVRVFLVVSALLIVVQCGLNLALNPAGRFREDGMLLRTIRASDTYRKLQAFDDFVAAHRGQPIGLVIGSSRVMMLSLTSEESAQGVAYFNIGISGALGEDILALTRYALSRPDANIVDVVIGVDFTTLGEPDDPTYGTRLQGIYPLTSIMDDRLDTGPADMVKNLLTADWARTLVGNIRPLPRTMFDASGTRLEEEYVQRVQRAHQSRAAYLQNHISLVLRSLPKDEHLDSRRVSDLREAVEQLIARGARVTFFMPPTHPELLQGLQESEVFNARMAETRAILADLDQSDQVVVHDFTDPSLLGLTSDDYWWDGYHYSAQAAAIIANALRTTP